MVDVSEPVTSYTETRQDAREDQTNPRNTWE